jgi:hypothetical protein
MTNKERIIRDAIRAYPDEGMVDVNSMTLDQIERAAVKNEFGDTLECFIILELCDVLDDDMTLVEARQAAAKALWQSAKDLTKVLDAMEVPK